MVKSNRLMKFASLFVAGGWILQFGGCGGDFFQLTLRNIPIGFGRAIGAFPSTIVTDIVGPLLTSLVPAVT